MNGRVSINPSRGRRRGNSVYNERRGVKKKIIIKVCIILVFNVQVFDVGRPPPRPYRPRDRRTELCDTFFFLPPHPPTLSPPPRNYPLSFFYQLKYSPARECVCVCVTVFFSLNFVSIYYYYTTFVFFLFT